MPPFDYNLGGGGGSPKLYGARYLIGTPFVLHYDATFSHLIETCLFFATLDNFEVPP